jgi:Cytochrome c3
LKHPVIAVALAFLGCSPAMAQISPGPLSHAHQQLEGVTKCAFCHDLGPGAGTRSFKCLECHVEIQHRLTAHAGFHAHEYKSSPAEADCIRCHADHNGEKFALIRLDRKSFDHTVETGMALEGKHKTVACEKCHVAKFIPAGARPEIKIKNLDHSFLGLSRECVSCHEDVHKGQEGTDCARCHSQDAWKPAHGFDHNRSNYPLTGKHQTVACEKCHEPAPKGQPVLFKGLKFGSCQDCHMDPHRGGFQEARFRGTCETCHVTGGWKINHPDKDFDHSSTKYPLKGKHAETPCAKCHKDSDYHRHLAFERCADCHEDVHKGQFKARVAGSDCSSCHDEKAFKPALFDKETHKKSAFPLEGKHADADCADCHQPKGKDAVYITRQLICSACHTDRHGGEFASAPTENKCDACHSQTGFAPTTFTVLKHADTRFALTGRHAFVLCADCHKLVEPAAVPLPLPVLTAAMRPPLPLAKTFLSGSLRQFHFASQTCESCHSDPHQTNLACESCHMTEQWKIVRFFDHSTTRFRLDGGHVKVRCGDCHLGTTPQFPMTPETCNGCHLAKDVHEGQFRRGAREEDCGACHVTAHWEAKEFDHDKTRFPLDVAHRNLGCEKCHREQRGASGKMTRIYRGTATECVQCH